MPEPAEERADAREAGVAADDAPPGGGAAEAPEAEESILGVTLEGLRRAAEEVETERSVAETLQRSLLSEDLPRVPGLRMAVRYVAGSTEAQVGGDWFDVIPLRDGRAGLVIGDVVGRGVRAAARMAHLQSALRAYALEGLRPSLVLERMNGFVREVERGGMVTALYAVVDPETGVMQFAAAGHPPPLLINPGGEATYARGPTGSPLGVLELPGYDDAVTALEAGTTVLMYTDGLVERPDQPLERGLERLIESLGGGTPQPERLCRDLMRSIFPNAGPRDDVAMLVAQLDADPDADRDLELDLRAEPGSLALMRRSVARWLRAVGASEAETYEVLVACGEACANAIAHAYPAAEASFEVHLSRAADAVSVTVRDFGRWRPPRAGTQGRGLGLMRELMDEVEIDKRDTGTAVRMVRKLIGESP